MASFQTIFMQTSKEQGWTQSTEAVVLLNIINNMIVDGKLTTAEAEDYLKTYTA